MTLQECSKIADVSITYSYQDKDNITPDGWCWWVEAGYQAFWSHNSYETAAEAEASLVEWLETWEGPTK